MNTKITMNDYLEKHPLSMSLSLNLRIANLIEYLPNLPFMYGYDIEVDLEQDQMYISIKQLVNSVFIERYNVNVFTENRQIKLEELTNQKDVPLEIKEHVQILLATIEYMIEQSIMI